MNKPQSSTADKEVHYTYIHFFLPIFQHASYYHILKFKTFFFKQDMVQLIRHQISLNRSFSIKKYQLKEWMREEKTTSVPPSSDVISYFGFFSKHRSTDFVRISIICTHIKSRGIDGQRKREKILGAFMSLLKHISPNQLTNINFLCRE